MSLFGDVWQHLLIEILVAFFFDEPAGNSQSDQNSEQETGAQDIVLFVAQIMSHNGKATQQSTLEQTFAKQASNIFHLGCYCTVMNLLHLSEEVESISEEDDTGVLVTPQEHCNESGPSSDSPEEIVRRENIQVNVFRLLVFVIQLVATVTTSGLIYRGVAAVNKTSFESSFHAVAERIVDAVQTDFVHKITTARAIAASVKGLLRGSSPLNTTLDQLDWEETTISARLALNSPMVSWSPLIQSDEDRLVFEEFAKTQTFKYGPFPPCFYCNEPTRGFTNPEKVISLPGLGPSTCGSPEIIGRKGIVPPPVCSHGIAALKDLGCSCGDIPAGPPFQPTSLRSQTSFLVPTTKHQLPTILRRIFQPGKLQHLAKCHL